MEGFEGWINELSPLSLSVSLSVFGWFDRIYTPSLGKIHNIGIKNKTMLNFEFLLALPGGLEFLIIFMIVSGLFILPIAFGIYFIVKAAKRKNDAKKANTME